MRWRPLGAAVVGGTVAAAVAIVALAPAERAWRVRWEDPNPGDPASRVLWVCDVGDCGQLRELVAPRRVRLADGRDVGLGFVVGGSAGAPPEVRGALIGQTGRSPLSAPLLLEVSTAYAEPVPEAPRLPAAAAGLLTVGLLARRRRRSPAGRA